MIFEILFWLLITLVLYSYIGYSLILALRHTICKPKKRKPLPPSFPHVTIVVAAYNEASMVRAKVENTLAQQYPQDRIHQLWVTDGSTDDTVILLKQYPGVKIIHDPQRRGKAAALNRAMVHVETPFSILCDANTILNPTAVEALMQEFMDPRVGCVAGEKRIVLSSYESAVSSGEGIYWKYESLIKRLESSNGSALSAAGELYAIRTELYQKLEEDTILDDFTVSTRIAQIGYLLKYTPKAQAIEYASLTIREEKKRKVRIAAGAFQFLFRNPQLVNIFRHPRFAFQFVSHKVLRWVVAPPSVIIAPVLNAIILFNNPASVLYRSTMLLILLFLLFVLLGWLGKNLRLRAKLLFIPYYIFTMNLSMLVGLHRYLSGQQKVTWDKAERAVD